MFGSPCDKEYNILGSLLRPLTFGNSHMSQGHSSRYGAYAETNIVFLLKGEWASKEQFQSWLARARQLSSWSVSVIICLFLE